MGEFTLYGLNEAGDPVFAEQLRLATRAELRPRASERLREHHAVEVWEGPLCVVRLRREPAPLA